MPATPVRTDAETSEQGADLLADTCQMLTCLGCLLGAFGGFLRQTGGLGHVAVHIFHDG